MTAGRQTTTNSAPARGNAGDPASANPRFSVDAGPFGIVAGPLGCTIGVFAWLNAPADGDGAPSQAVNQSNGGPVAGFVSSQLQGTITVYLADASMSIIAGQQMNLESGTDFWAVNADTIAAPYQGTVYAELGTGKIKAQAGTASFTGTIDPETFSVTGSIAGDTMTVTAVGSGTVVPGAKISGASVASGTQVTRQLTPLLAGETAGGVGRYAVSIPEQSVASTTISGTYGLLTVASGLTGTIMLGGLIAGSGVTASSHVTGFGTGVGGVGTYYTENTQTVGSESLTTTTTVSTKWKFASVGAAGELVKITSQPLG